MMDSVVKDSECRSFIRIIFPKMTKEEVAMKLAVSILYKYHISHIVFTDEAAPKGVCRSFISIIVPNQDIEIINNEITSVNPL